MLSKFVLLNRVLDSLRDGSFLKRVISYFTYRDTIVRMQMNLENLPKMIELNPLYDIREVNTADEQDIIHWIDVVNDGYGEGEGGGNDPERHFNKHIFLENIKAYFITYEGTPIATISIGNYKSKKNWGGGCPHSCKGGVPRTRSW